MVKLVDAADADEKVGLRLRGSTAKLPRRNPANDAPARHVDPGDTSSEEIELPGDSNVHVDGETGIAVIENADGTTTLDFSGRDTSKERPALRRGRTSGFHENLAEKPGVDLASLAWRLLQGIEDDMRARMEWEEMGNNGARLLGVRWEEATIDVSPEGSISKAYHPMLLEAVLRSWANSRAELLPAGGPVKVRDDLPPQPDMQLPGIGDAGGDGGLGGGPPPAGGPSGGDANPMQRKRSEKADGLEKDMNHMLTAVDRGYYSDFSRMLMAKAFKGSQFRKVFYEPVVKRPLSRWVMGTDLIISNDGTDLAQVSRVTERSLMQQAQVKRMQALGYWRDIRLGLPMPTPTSTDESQEETSGIAMIERGSLPADHRHEIYECHCFCDEGDLAYDYEGRFVGYPLPYRVTIDKTSRQIPQIVRDWKEHDETYQRRTRYVHYGFCPTVTNTFYHWGLVHLMGSSQRAATAMEREFIDAEMLASFPGGVMAKGPGTKTDKTTLRGGPGQFDVIETGGEDIRTFVMPWPYKGASQQLDKILQEVVSETRRMAGTLELPVGEGRVGNVPVGTVMAFVDSISKIPSAVFKDDHIAQQEEFLLLKELYAEHPECILSPNNRQWTREEVLDQDLVPAADPNTPSYVHRIMQAMAIMEMLKLYAQFPQLGSIPNGKAIWEWCLKVLGVESVSEFTLPPQPPGQAPPDLAGAAQMMKAKNDQEKNQIEKQKLGQKQQDTQRQAASDAVEADQRTADRQSEAQIEHMRMNVETVREHRQMEHERDMAQTEHAVDLHKHQTGIAHEQQQTALQQQHEAEQSAAGLEQEDVHHQEQLGHEAGIADSDRASAEKQAKAKPKPKPKGST